MLIRCLLIRKGGSHIDIENKTYHFMPNEKGHYVAEVSDKKHIACFLRVPEAYEVYDENDAVDMGAMAVENMVTPDRLPDTYRDVPVGQLPTKASKLLEQEHKARLTPPPPKQSEEYDIKVEEVDSELENMDENDTVTMDMAEIEEEEEDLLEIQDEPLPHTISPADQNDQVDQSSLPDESQEVVNEVAAPKEDVETIDINPDDMSDQELRKQCKDLEIPFGPRTKREDLIAKLVEYSESA